MNQSGCRAFSRKRTMGEGQESAWPNLALRAEIKPCIEKNSISTPFGFKSCHRRHLRRIVFWSPLLLFARWEEFARLSSLGFVRGLIDLAMLALGRIGESRLAIACD